MLKQAAALILIRDTSSGIEVCMLRRVSSSRFAPGAYVFPGGGIEEQDEVFNISLDGSKSNTAKIAAIRETFEEAGILSGTSANTHHFSAHDRDGLNKGEITFQHLIEQHDIHLDLESITFYDHWITPEGAPIRFDTRFFLAIANVNQEVFHDDAETDASCWAKPANLLAQYDREEIKLMPVTHVQLLRLSDVESINDLIENSRQQTISPIRPILNFNEDGKPMSVTIKLKEGIVDYPVFLKKS
ncbi:MAG: NUDIX domain-containing protein [Cycloclasticus sp.]|nr:NUDIX domain-containing protein [Cycloclasticus sp.]